MKKLYTAISIAALLLMFFLIQSGFSTKQSPEIIHSKPEPKSKSIGAALTADEEETIKNMSADQRAEYISLNTDKKIIGKVNQSMIDDRKNLDQIEEQLKTRDEEAQKILQRLKAESTSRGEAQ